MSKPLSFEQFQSAIFLITEESVNATGIYFLSGSYELERSYSNAATYRWYEIYLFLHGLPDRGKVKVLDVGVTPFTFFIKKIMGLDVEALDLSAAFETRCKLHGIPFFSGGLFTTDPAFLARKYDVVLFLEVIEHIHKNPVSVLSHLKGFLNEGGRLYLTTPNLMVLSNRVKMLLNKKLDQLHYPPFEHNTPDHGPEHDRVYMPAELKEYCPQSGFTSFRLGYSTALEKYRFKQKTLLKKGLQLIGFAIKKIFPSTASTIVLVLKK